MPSLPAEYHAKLWGRVPNGGCGGERPGGIATARRPCGSDPGRSVRAGARRGRLTCITMENYDSGSVGQTPWSARVPWTHSANATAHRPTGAPAADQGVCSTKVSAGSTKE
jgi:hypothetical protein